MDELISRQAAIEAIVNTVSTVGLHDNSETALYGSAFRQNEIIDIIEQLPSAERTGRWIFNIDDQGWSWDYPYMCDQCGEWAEKVFKFCPNCGAKMEGEAE